MAKQTKNHPISVSFVSLGCAKNLVDSEKMLALMALAGILPVGPDDPADVVVVNTCGFIEDARREAIENIEYALDNKQKGHFGRVVVTGCLAQYCPDKLLEDMPGIDAVVGLGKRDQIAEIIRGLIDDGSNMPNLYMSDTPRNVADDRARLRITDRPWAYLRVSEGCSRGCSFCTIPAIRGPFRSKSPDIIVAEAVELVSDGAVEINLIGQETSGYGTDIGYERGLAGILEELNRLDGLRWIRIMYGHPATLADDQIKAMAKCEKVIPYIDLPLQHINDRILKLMGRRITRQKTVSLLATLRSEIANLSIRTTMLVGFPSETDAEFDELMEFVKAFRFEAMGCFAYSAELPTPAARMKGQIANEIKNSRCDRLMLAQRRIAFEKADALIGRPTDCLLIDELDDDEAESLGTANGGRWFLGRHRGQSPEVDSETYISVDGDFAGESGDIVSAKITGRIDYDLLAVCPADSSNTDRSAESSAGCASG